MSLQQHRAEFPYLAGKAYFNYGGQGTMPRSAIAALQDANIRFQELGPFSSAANSWIVQEGNLTRAAIAKELGTTADTITLTEDVSVGCNIALWGIDWQAGDHILLTDCEHQGIVAAVQELQRRFDLKVSVCPLLETLNSGDPSAIVEQFLQPNTRLFVVSHILWNTGQVLPLQEMVEICHARSVQVLVDAAQSVGVLPLNLTELNADFYAFTGHKWWCGAAGVGALYVRPEARETLHPTFIGWRSVITDASGQPTRFQPDGRVFEIATSAIPLYPALREAIAFHQPFAEARYGMICDRSAYLWQRLKALPSVQCLKTSAPASGLVSFQLENGKHPQLVQYLEARNFFLRVILNPNCVRACVHYFTTEEEIDALAHAIEEFL
ncbi:MAG: aminotransferase class V-fold PLP-dependent enzyme [Leptolyngbya sp. UWPOB_LEPTO1]|uniref:aminotransferase class V-fold PLP-dependent enzyme n=1 Tax=Leptolyngbya sp. UWPOB_LEPTO1 TaxID=2815653 RepID=UPI001AC18F98|nr:aminotransferase class V-fold PLP-dependent enzyme [Leptolyngbya sp. UWPOB_LEPTO1]MBN8560896.1 aminotransferase class V-fold PLP-dependent enzyme [Leptolyngbya sp. UWPOB_LEPTO1]